MAISVTPNLTDISLCDAIGLWTGTSIVIDAALMVQGAGCCSIQVKATTSANQLWTYTEANGIDMTGKHIYIWMMVTGVVDTKANGGYRIYVEDTLGHYSTFYVGGKDTFPGGWGCFVVDPASTARASGSGTVDPLHIKKVGVAFKTLSTALGSTKNCFWDACRYGTGLTVTSGAADAINLGSIFGEDDLSANKYGVITKATGGIYVIQGLLTLGGTGAENVDFLDKSQIVLFPDNAAVSDSFYGIKVLAGSGTINFTLGETPGIKGCLFKALGAKSFSLDVSDTDIDKMQLYGCTFNNAGTITLLPNAANREVLKCAFESCGEVIVNTCIITDCNFISSDGAAVLMSAVSHCQNITKCNFITCAVGIRISVYGVGYDFNALMFSDTGWYHVNNDCGQALSIGKSNSSNPSTYTGSAVTFTGSITLTMVVKNEAGNPIVGAWAFIDQDPPVEPWIMNMQTITGGIASVSHTLGAVPGSIWRVRKYGYKNFKQVIDIGEVNISLPITLVADPQT